MELAHCVIIASCMILLATLVGLSVYTIHRDTVKENNSFKIQMEAARSRAKPEIHRMPYSDLMKIVNETIDYYATRNLNILTLANKSSDEISLLLDDLSADIATKVKVSVSPYVSECITCYVTEDFYDRYIINSVRMLLLASIEQKKRASMRGNNRPAGTNNNQQTKNKT